MQLMINIRFAIIFFSYFYSMNRSSVLNRHMLDWEIDIFRMHTLWTKRTNEEETIITHSFLGYRSITIIANNWTKALIVQAVIKHSIFGERIVFMFIQFGLVLFDGYLSLIIFNSIPFSHPFHALCALCLVILVCWSYFFYLVSYLTSFPWKSHSLFE